MATFRVTGNVSKEKRAALGQVCIQWAILEQRIEQLIWAFQGVNRKTGRQITGNMASIRPRITKLLNKTHNSNLATRDKALLQRMALHIRNDLAFERNWVVHGLWGKGREPGMKRRTYAISYFDNPDGLHHEMSLEYLNDLSARIGTAAELLTKFMIQKFGAPIP